MSLFQATDISCRYTMTSSWAQAYSGYIKAWMADLRRLYPHVRESVPRSNVHAAAHIYDFLSLFGPVTSWWCFPFERLIGTLQKVNTNDHKGGEMEATIVKSMARTANIRRWLRRPDYPEAICQLKVLFDECFIPVHAPHSEEFVERKGARHAYLKFEGGNLSPFDTHMGNSNIIYQPPSGPPVAGQIQYIENVHSRNGQNVRVRIHVQPYNPLSRALHDPFLQYPHFPAKTYSSTLRETEDVIEIDDVVSQAAQYNYSHGWSVIVDLSRQ
ncbi:hypothetical protein F5050DRAFT_1795865 [Lentinula boryana]|uniref:Uncharacterized protein n=1 Tax=Lentinula boryana TaxID=40481 RepID=A0ABQ8PW06_9AGAR|nr:hypothetical protein F5050DRAFT_1795865 [Lentinula boryana]